MGPGFLTSSRKVLVLILLAVLTACGGARVDDKAPAEQLFGLFEKIVRFDIVNEPNQVGFGDLNGDGWLDMLIDETEATLEQTDEDNTIHFVVPYFATRDGGFTKGTRIEIKTFPIAPFITADINYDGNLDIFYYDFADIYLILGDGSGGFSDPKLVFHLETSNESGKGFNFDADIRIVDYDGDGALELIRPGLRSGEGNLAGGKDDVKVYDWDNTIDWDKEVPTQEDDEYIGGFSATPLYVRSEFSASLLVDLNNDNAIDLIGSDYNSQQETKIYLQSSTGSFPGQGIVFNEFPLKSALSVGDFDGDEDLDIVAVKTGAVSSDSDDDLTPYDFTLYLVTQSLNNTFFTSKLYGGRTPSMYAGVPYTYAADFDRNGSIELVFATNQDRYVFIYEIDPLDESNLIRHTIDITKYLSLTGAILYNVLVEDLDNDGNPDLILGIGVEDLSGGVNTKYIQVLYGVNG